MGEKHSAVGYLFREGAFLPAQETKPVRNEFGLDLFQHRPAGSAVTGIPAQCGEAGKKV